MNIKQIIPNFSHPYSWSLESPGPRNHHESGKERNPPPFECKKSNRFSIYYGTKKRRLNIIHSLRNSILNQKATNIRKWSPPQIDSPSKFAGYGSAKHVKTDLNSGAPESPMDQQATRFTKIKKRKKQRP